MRIHNFLILCALFAFGACEDDQDPAPRGSVMLHFEELVDGVPVVEYNDGSDTRYTNAAGNVYGVSNVEYLLSDFTMLGPGGVSKDSRTIGIAHYRNAFDAGTRTLLLDNLPAGQYDGISFWWGVPPEKNFGSPGSGPKGLSAAFDDMLWPMGIAGGYHCMRFEGVYDKAASDDGSFQLHMGRLVTLDGATIISTDGHFLVTLADMDLQIEPGQTLHLSVQMELNAWLDDPLIDFTASTPNGMALDGPTMPNHQAQSLMRANGDDVFSAEETTDLP